MPQEFLISMLRLREKIVPGTQVLYVPDHLMKKYNPDFQWIDASILHQVENSKKWSPSGPELGFIFEPHLLGTCYCRFFFHPAQADPRELRTTDNSELCFWENLFYYNHKPQEFIDKLIKEIHDKQNIDS